MGSLIKYIGAFLLGAASGAGVAWIFATKKAEKDSEEKIMDMEAYFKAKYSDDPPIDAERGTDETAPVTSPKAYAPDPMPAPKEAALTKKKVNKEMHDYTQHYNGAAAAEPNDDEYDENYALGLAASKEVAESSGPEIISVSELGNDPRLSMVTLNYYMVDGAITLGEYHTMEEAEITDIYEITAMIGDLLDESGFTENDDETLAIINRKMGAYYEINKQFASYDGG